MADTKIRQLTELSAAATTDYIQVIDVSDTTFGSDGTNKQITKSNFLNGFDVDSLTSTATELNQLDGVTVGGSAAGDIVDTQSTQTGLTGKTFDEITITNGTTSANGINFGSDVNLYRIGENSLRTDDNFIIGATASPNKVNIYTGNASDSLQFGDAAGGYDTNLYRSAANTLKTDDNLIIAGTPTSTAGSAVTTDGTQTLTNKTITLPKIGTALRDANNNEMLWFSPTSSANTEFTIKNAATGENPHIYVSSDDAGPIAGKFQGKSAFNMHVGIANLGTVGATETVDWSNGDRQKMTLDENLTITFSNAEEGQTLTLSMLQDGTGTNTITFSDTIVWADNTTPSWTTTANKWNVAVITYVGGEYLGVGNKFA